jgi:hypothetical protein
MQIFMTARKSQKRKDRGNWRLDGQRDTNNANLFIECCKAKHRGEMFPGATIADMHSNFKPVLHVGTNDAANRKAREITKDVTICVRK